MKIYDRIKQMADKKGISMYTLSQETGISQATFSRLKSGNTEKLNRKNIKLLSEYFKVSMDWLVTGNEEEVVEKKVEVREPIISALPIEQGVVNIPLVNQYAYAGYLDGYADITYLEQLPRVPFIVDHEGRGNYLAFEVKGDSMDDGTQESYVDGDRLYCREVQRHLWAQYKLHLRHWDFVIVHVDGILLKRIIDHDVENHTITIHSLNPMYADKVIDLAEVIQIFNVIESVRPRKR